MRRHVVIPCLLVAVAAIAAVVTKLLKPSPHGVAPVEARGDDGAAPSEPPGLMVRPGAGTRAGRPSLRTAGVPAAGPAESPEPILMIYVPELGSNLPAIRLGGKEAFMERRDAEKEAAGIDREVRTAERAMRQRAESLRKTMTVDEALATVAPLCCHTNPMLPVELLGGAVPARLPHEPWRLEVTYLVLSPHPARAHHLIGDTFRVLEVFFDADKKLAHWRWEYPPRD